MTSEGKDMENYIIAGIVIIALGLLVRSTVKHFRGQGGCCGGGSGYKPRKKKLTAIRYQKLFSIEGMHCEHCKNRVEEVVNDIKGVVGKVNLKNGELTVFYAEDVDDEKIKERIERAGYRVTEIK